MKIDRPKIFVEIGENGNLKIDDEMRAMFLSDKKYKLVRESDGKIVYGSSKGWVEWDENNSFKKIHDEPAVGRSLILDPNSLVYAWLTTQVVEILDEQEGYIKFTTLNSVYELFKIK